MLNIPSDGWMDVWRLDKHHDVAKQGEFAAHIKMY